MIGRRGERWRSYEILEMVLGQLRVDYIALCHGRNMIIAIAIYAPIFALCRPCGVVERKPKAAEKSKPESIQSPKRARFLDDRPIAIEYIARCKHDRPLIDLSREP